MSHGVNTTADDGATSCVHHHTETIICPYCNADNGVLKHSRHDSISAYLCRSCKRYFRIVIEKNHVFTTAPLGNNGNNGSSS